jgi:DNA polymerase-3 subunit beta
MKFTVEKQTILRELAYIQQTVADKRGTIPALTYVRIEASGKRIIRLSGTDLDQTLTCETEGAVQKAGVCALPGKKLFEIIKQLPEAEVVFESKDADRMLITCERASFKLAGMNPKDLPELPKFKESSAQLPADVIRTMIERTRFCITQEESRYTLSGAKFILRKKGVRVVTTDGHRLALIDNRTITSAHELDVLIPKNALISVSRLAAAHEGAVGLASDENHIYFEIGARTLVSRLIAGTFPNYEMVIPKSNEHKVEFDCSELLQIIRRVAVMSDERSRALRLEFKGKKLTVRAEEDGQGAAEETIPIEYGGARIVIGINSNYLAEYLAVLGSGAIRFEFKDALSPVQIRPLGEPGYNSFNIIMPMNLGDVAPAASSNEQTTKAAAEEAPAPEESAPVAKAA